MPDEERLFHEHIIAEYRQALADAQFALAKANARNAVQAQMLDQLTAPAN